MKDIFFREIKMPATIRAFTLLDYNGDYNVYVNTDLSDCSKESAIKHEICHIENDDFYSSLPASRIEEALIKKRNR